MVIPTSKKPKHLEWEGLGCRTVLGSLVAGENDTDDDACPYGQKPLGGPDLEGEVVNLFGHELGFGHDVTFRWVLL